MCSECGPVALKSKGWQGGIQRWACRPAWEARNVIRGNRPNGVPKTYRKHVQAHCEDPRCTATIEDRCQLDVHHRDGNARNNERANLVTLCANCHRLAHHQQRD